MSGDSPVPAAFTSRSTNLLQLPGRLRILGGPTKFWGRTPKVDQRSCQAVTGRRRIQCPGVRMCQTRVVGCVSAKPDSTETGVGPGLEVTRGSLRFRGYSLANSEVFVGTPDK
jgi:hypothetical protein